MYVPIAVNLDADCPPVDPDGLSHPRKMFYVDACEHCAWHLQIWRKEGDGEITYIPYKCRSWRHEGECRLWRGAQDFVRIEEGMRTEEHWSHITLTFRQKGYVLSPKMFISCKDSWAKLRKRISRKYGILRYIQTWESHKSGWPHCHIAASNVELFSWQKAHPRAMFSAALGEMVRECGFGPIGWLEPLRSKIAMAGYLCKLARELTGSGKEYQIPVKAPRHFRRIRASVRLLPPPHKDPDITGVLRYCKLPEGG